jgi:NADPH:quinone reductase-like Zn-dependent oxidoreductase
VELVIDAVGGKSFKQSFRSLAPSGRLGMFGLSSSVSGGQRRRWATLRAALSTPWFAFNPLRLIDQNKGVFGVNLGHLWEESDRVNAWLETLIQYYQKSLIHPVIAAKFSFDEAAEAHHYLQDRKNIGKVLLTP